MSSDRRNASPSPAPELPPRDPAVAELVRARGAPLLEALESHLPGSAQHADTTGAYAFAAATGIGLDRTAAELCRETAKLHDVGMVYVPVATARTPFESWGDKQRQDFEAHYEAGAQLARGAGIPDEVCGWLLKIRERFDGGGAEKLTGSAIPVASRLARAACACDTLLASPQGAEQLADRRRDAIERLRGAAGRELDPLVVEALVGALGAKAAP